MSSRPVNRLLLLAPPGEGKTTLIKSIVREYRIGGTILDPLKELGSVAGVRWDRREEYDYSPDWSGIPDPENDDPTWVEEYRAYCEMLSGIGRGEMLIADEAARFIPSGASPKNALLKWSDVARNKGAKFVFAEKRPARLSALTVDLATHLAFRPWRSASARRWLADAGADVESLPPLPMLAPSLDNPWYLLRVGGGVEETTAREILRGVLDSSALSS